MIKESKIGIKALVTGHRGFIGSHLFEKLKGMGWEVVGVDLLEGRDIRFLVPEDFEGVDYVFHLAAKAKIYQSIENPVFTNDHNVSGTLNVLDCARKAGVKRVIYSASSSAYGNQKIPQREDMTPKPMSPYGLQKLIGEEYCRIFSEVYGLSTVSLRYFNVYGEDCPVDSPYAACIARFLQFKKEGKSLPIYGGKQTRDFTYMEDVVDANILAALSGKVGSGEVVNIGGGKNYSIEEIAKTISDNVVYEEPRKNEALHSLADISKAKRLLSWQPKTNILKWLQLQNN